VLALDTSHPVGSVSVAGDGRAAATVSFGADASHLAGIGPASAEALERAGVTLDDVRRVAVTIGPGSFTGLRIGLAFAKGLVASRDIELVAVSTLELIALPHLEAHALVCAMIDARRNEVYAALYRGTDAGRAEPLLEPRALSAADLMQAVRAHAQGPVAFAGTGALRYRDVVETLDGAVIIEGDAAPSSGVLAVVAGGITPVPAAEVPALEPAYLRPSGAERKRLRPIDP